MSADSGRRELLETATRVADGDTVEPVEGKAPELHNLRVLSLLGTAFRRQRNGRCREAGDGRQVE